MLPEYIAKAVPNPKTNRAPWYANTAPAYAGIFLWVAFYQSIAAGAMVVVVVNEMVPIAVRGAGRHAGLAAAAGFAVTGFLATINV